MYSEDRDIAMTGDIKLAAVFRERFPETAKQLDTLPEVVRFLVDSEFAGSRCRWCGTKDGHATGCRWVQMINKIQAR